MTVGNEKRNTAKLTAEAVEHFVLFCHSAGARISEEEKSQLNDIVEQRFGRAPEILSPKKENLTKICELIEETCEYGQKSGVPPYCFSSSMYCDCGISCAPNALVALVTT